MSTAQHTQELLAQAGWVRSLAAELVRDGAAAEDLAQETLLAAYQRPPNDPSALRAYLRSVLRNLLRRGARDADRRIAREQRSARPEALPSAAETAERFATHRELVAAVEALAEPYRSTVLLRHFEELPPRKIAARLGIPVKTVDTRLARAHALLRERLDAEHGSDRRAWAAVLVRCFRPELPVEGSLLPSGSAATWAGAAAVLAAGLAVFAIVFWREAHQAREMARAARLERGQLADELAKLGYIGTTRDRASIPAVAPQALLEGRVRTRSDSTGASRAIAGAAVEVRFRPADGTRMRLGSFGEAEEVLGTAVSGADGAFSIEVPAGRLVDVRVRAAGFGTVHRPLVGVPGALDVVLEPAATLAVAAVDAGGAPVAEARVKVFATGGAHVSGVAGDPIVQGTTDAVGRWRSAELPPGVFRIEMQSARHPTLRVRNLVLRSGDVVERELQFRGSAVVAGTVRDASTGEAVGGASVRLEPVGEIQDGPTRGVTDDQGGFRIEGLDPDASHAIVAVRAVGFAAAEVRVQVAGDAPPTARVELRSGHSVSGRLRTVDGTPVAGAWVVAYGHVASGAITPTDWIEARADAKGSFDLPCLRSDLPHALFVRVPGFGSLARELRAGADGERIELGDVLIEKGASIEGRVVRDDGAPAPGAVVHLEPSDPSASAIEGHVEIGVGAGSAPAEAVLDEEPLHARDALAGDDGSFRMLDVAPGSYRAVARIGFLRSAKVDVTLAAGGEEREMRLAIPRGLSIEGRVVDEAGEPLGGAWILLFRQGARLEERSQETDADGRFRLEGLEAIPYRLSAGRSGGDAPFASVEVGDLLPPRLDVEVRLSRTVPFEGRVVDAEGRPLARALVDARDGDGRDLQAVSDAEGRFRLAVAAGARLDLSGSWPGPGAQARDGKRRVGKLAGVAAGAREVVLTLDGPR